MKVQITSIQSELQRQTKRYRVRQGTFENTEIFKVLLEVEVQESTQEQTQWNQVHSSPKASLYLSQD